MGSIYTVKRVKNDNIIETYNNKIINLKNTSKIRQGVNIFIKDYTVFFSEKRISDNIVIKYADDNKGILPKKFLAIVGLQTISNNLLTI